MGSHLSSCSRVVTVGSFDMAGVPAEVVWETICDLEALPSFVPHVLQVQPLRGDLLDVPTVGASWNERRIFDGKEIIMRKTITGLDLEPEHGTYTVQLVMHIEGTRYSSPDAVETCTFTVAPLLGEDGKRLVHSCTIGWTIAFIGAGFWGTFALLLCKSCFLRSGDRELEKEMQCFYEEGMRRTKNHERKAEKSATEENSSLEPDGVRN